MDEEGPHRVRTDLEITSVDRRRDPKGNRPEMDCASHVERARTDARKLKAKASNSIFAFPGNGRTAAARRYRDLVAGMLKDLAVAEQDLGDSAKLQLRNTALLAVTIEQAQADAMRGKPVDMIWLLRAHGVLGRKLWALGLGKRRRKTLTPEDALDVAQRLQEASCER